MIYENLDVVVNKLGVVNNACGDAIHFLHKLKKAAEVVTITNDQKIELMDGIETNKNAVASGYISLVDAFQATDPI